MRIRRYPEEDAFGTPTIPKLRILPEINLQAPDDSTTGPVDVVVTNSMGSTKVTVMLASLSPSFILLDDGKHVAGWIPTPDGTGEYGGGSYDLLGPAPTTNPVSITVGDLPANVAFAGISEAGLYQFNVTVPNAGSGDQAVGATVSGAQTLPGPT